MNKLRYRGGEIRMKKTRDGRRNEKRRKCFGQKKRKIREILKTKGLVIDMTWTENRENLKIIRDKYGRKGEAKK